MFGRVRTLHHPDLGTLTRSRRLWRGRITIAGSEVPLSIMGTRDGPDPVAVALACSIPSGFEGWRSSIDSELRDHATTADVAATASTPTIPCYAAVIALDGQPSIELGYQVPWEEEHTLGARIRGDRLVELNGSVLEP